MDRLAHMLTLYVSPNDGDQYGLTLAMSSADRGRRGVLIQPFGAITFQNQVGLWNIRVKALGSITGLLLGPDGVETSGGESWGLALEAERVAEIEGVTTTLGGGGTGVTFGKIRIQGQLELAQKTRHAALDLVIDQARFAVAGSDGDSFLSSVLPPEGLSANVDFAIGWSNRNGFHVSGGAGLEATWPLHARLGPVRLDSIKLGIATEGSAIRTQASFNAGLNVGPFAILIDGVGLETLVEFPENGGNLGVANLDLDFKPPNGVGLADRCANRCRRGIPALRYCRRGSTAAHFNSKIAEKISVKGIGC